MYQLNNLRLLPQEAEHMMQHMLFISIHSFEQLAGNAGHDTPIEPPTLLFVTAEIFAELIGCARN